MSGSVEAACGLGLADGIVDLVETGTTMRVSGCVGVSIDVDDYCSLMMVVLGCCWWWILCHGHCIILVIPSIRV